MTARAATRRARLDLAARLVGLAALLLIAGGSLYISRQARSTANAVDRVQDDQVLALLGSCERVNRLRQNDNRVAETQYETLRTAAGLLSDTPDLSDDFLRLSMTVDYIPLTDCERAVGTPAQFRAPAPIPIHTLTAAQRATLQREGAL